MQFVIVTCNLYFKFLFLKRSIGTAVMFALSSDMLSSCNGHELAIVRDQVKEKFCFN